MNSETDLKDCPFCGGKAELEHGIQSWNAICRGCGMVGVSFINMSLAVDAWNRRPLTPSGAGEAVSDEAVEAAKDAYGKASLSAGFSGYVDPHWMRAALTAALPYLRPAQSQEGVKMKWLTGQELWEIMFTALKGDVPDKLTDTALDEIASAVRCAALTPPEGGE